MPTPANNPASRWVIKLQGLVAKAVGWLATSWTRAVVIGLGALYLFYLLFMNVWQPLFNEASLPPGVTPNNPTLDISILKAINNQRAQRVQHEPVAYDRQNSLFTPYIDRSAP